jgi:cation diffusion facilitator family transporter
VAEAHQSITEGHGPEPGTPGAHADAGADGQAVGPGGGHAGGHGGGHAGGHGHGKKAIVAALFANLGIAIAKFVGFLITRSSALLAETVHSLADTGNQGLLLLGGARAKKEASDKHPFGYGRERFFWSFVVALVLFSLGALFAIYEGVQKLRHPHHLDSPIVAVVILAVAIVLEIFSFRTAIVEARAIKGDQSWISFIRHAKNPELPVVLLEDLGALAGLVIALAGVGLVELTDNADFDAYSTLTIGALLGVIAVVLAIEMKSLLIGESASITDTATIRAALERSPRVRRLIHLRTLHIGPEELLVAAKIELDAGLSFPQVTEAINESEQILRDAVPTARIVYLEPDLFDKTR